MFQRVATAVAAAVFVVVAALPAQADVNTTFFGVAIHGYDPVAYHTEGRPVEGSKAFTHEWKGATWRFASADHRDLFIADPERYAPAYGGYCAYAVAQGGKADIDPNAWSIVDGQLYLNLNARVQRLWQQDIPGHIARADANWSRLIG